MANRIGHTVPRSCAKCGVPLDRKDPNYRRKKYCNPICMGLAYRHSPEQAEASFWSRVDKNGPNGCWVYTGHRNKDNYGAINIRQEGRVHRLAHRYTWALKHGEVPKGYHVLHRCDNPPCCNPDHLWLGTDADNCQDMYQKGRDGSRGERNSHAVLNAEKVLTIRAEYRRDNHSKSNAKELAARYGVTAEAILHIVARRCWKHLP